MWFTRISIANPVLATMMMVALLVLGVFAYDRLPVELFPDVTFPVVVVETAYPGASPASVEQEVTRPIEEAVNTVSGIKTLRSRSYQGLSVVIAEFHLSIDPRLAAQDVRERVAAVRASFRPEVKEPRVSRFDPADAPVVAVGLTSPSRSLRELTTLADQVIKPRLENVSGVGQATVVGGTPREIRVVVHPNRLQAEGIGVDEVMRTLRDENQEAPAGSLIGTSRERAVEVRGRLADPHDFAGLVVARRNGTPITLGELADIEDTHAELDTAALIDGKPAVAINVVKSQGENTLEVVNGVRAAMAELAPSLPSGVHLQLLRDESIGVKRAVADVRTTLALGAALTIAIVFLFLASWRSTVITGLTLPISLIGTFAVISALGYSLNTLTLMAMSLSVGLLIDDAIVVRENIVRHAALGAGPRTAALEGTREIGLAVLATTLSIVAVFLPVGFMGGIIGRFFHQFGVTVAVAVLLSMFVSFTLDPMLSSRWHDPQAGGRAGLLAPFRRLQDRVAAGYRRALGWSLAHRKSVLAIALVAFVGAFPLLRAVGTEFVPQADLSQLQVDFATPVGSSIELTERKSAQVSAALRALPEVETTYTSINTAFARGPHNASMFVQLVPKERRSLGLGPLSKLIRHRVETVAGVTVKQVGPPNRFGGGKPIQVSVTGPALPALERLAAGVERTIRAMPQFTDLESSDEAALPTVAVELKRPLASDLGIGVAQVADTLGPLVAGEAAGTWRAADGQYYDVRVRLPSGDRERPSDLATVPLLTQPGAQGPRVVTLGEVASLRETTGRQEIDRRDQRPEVLLSANVAPGAPPGDAGAALQARLDTLHVPPGYRVDLVGSTQDLAETTGYAGQALALAVIFIYLILASQFASFLQPLAIMASLPLSLIGVAGALLVAGSTLNLFSAIGFIMLMGLVTKNAILLVDFINRARREGVARAEAVLSAGEVRLRPIAMTTLAMIFGMLPLALGLGEGGEQRAPMGQAVIGGVLASGLLTLIVVPVIYTYLDDLATWVRRFARIGGSPKNTSVSP